jgi:uncharacterized protein YicC (UPF0701 family)
MAKAVGKTETSQEYIPSGGSVDQIREILFGAAQREHEARASRMEKLIERRARDLADRLAKLQATSERELEQTTSDLGARLDQLSERLDQVEAVAKKDTTAAARDLSEKITRLDKRASKDLEAQDDRLQDKINAIREELTAAVQRLDQEKTGNTNLGDCLMEIGMRLKGDPALGTIESSLSEMLKAKPDEKT